jgi:hypothetical protein
MSSLPTIVLIIAILLLVVGGIVKSLKFLIWVGLVLFIIAALSYLGIR